MNAEASAYQRPHGFRNSGRLEDQAQGHWTVERDFQCDKHFAHVQRRTAKIAETHIAAGARNLS